MRAGCRHVSILPRATDILGRAAGRVTCLTVRLTEFWQRMRAQFGETYAESVAKDHVFAKLGSRTVNQALADGVAAKTIWRVVSDEFDVPQHLR
jgi:hypothetical protein